MAVGAETVLNRSKRPAKQSLKMRITTPDRSRLENFVGSTGKILHMTIAAQM